MERNLIKQGNQITQSQFNSEQELHRLAWWNWYTQGTFVLTDIKREPYNGNVISGDG